MIDLGPAIPLMCIGKTYEIEVLLSPEDYDWAVRQGNWFITSDKTTGDHKGYACRHLGSGFMWLHKEVLKRDFQLPPTPRHTIGDHGNGNRRDNRRRNLRWATHQMNARNTHGFIHQQIEFDLHIERKREWGSLRR
jgi:hypothetical protein